MQSDSQLEGAHGACTTSGHLAASAEHASMADTILHALLCCFLESYVNIYVNIYVNFNQFVTSCMNVVAASDQIRL